MEIRTEEENVQSSLGLPTLTAPELCHMSDTEGNYDYLSNRSEHISQPVSAVRGVVRFDPKQMEMGAPYPFRLSDSWFVAVKRQEGHIDFLYVQ